MQILHFALDTINKLYYKDVDLLIIKWYCKNILTEWYIIIIHPQRGKNVLFNNDLLYLTKIWKHFEDLKNIVCISVNNEHDLHITVNLA